MVRTGFRRDRLRSARSRKAASDEPVSAWQPVVKVWLHSTDDASPPAALLLAQILPVFSVVAPCRRGASPVSMRRQTFATDCKGKSGASGQSPMPEHTGGILHWRYAQESLRRGAYCHDVHDVHDVHHRSDR